jgi:hypothetical protein
MISHLLLAEQRGVLLSLRLYLRFQPLNLLLQLIVCPCAAFRGVSLRLIFCVSHLFLHLLATLVQVFEGGLGLGELGVSLLTFLLGGAELVLKQS